MWRIARTLPVTVVTVASFAGFVLAAVLPSPWSLVLFYMFALPYYVAALLVMVFSQSLGLQATWAVVFGLAFAVDVAVIFPFRRRAGRVGPRPPTGGTRR